MGSLVWLNIVSIAHTTPLSRAEVATKQTTIDSKIFREKVVDGDDDDEKVPYARETPEHHILYGEYDRRRAQGPHITGVPITLHRARMEAKLQQWLFDKSEIFDVPETQLPGLGFLSDLDDIEYTHGVQGNPHRYYEGYFHGLKAPHIAKGSTHPRYGDRRLDKQAAPLRFRAFLEAFRHRNPWIKDVMSVLSEQMIERGHPKLAPIFSDPERMFADLAVQVHFGSEQLPIWHNDGLNSMLHMAVSIHGSRVVHALLDQRKPAVDRIVHQDKGVDLSQLDWSKVFENPQGPADVYVSSPVGYIHGVTYPQSTYATRVIAVQCRLLMDGEQYDALHSLGTREWLQLIGSHVTPILARAEVELPLFTETKAVYEEMLAHEV